MTTEVLKGARLRKTRAREHVLELLNKAHRPLSHQEIVDHNNSKKLDRVTVYRTLQALQRARLLHRVQGVDGILRFGLHSSNEESECGGNHVHFLCSKCSRMACLPEQPLPWVAAPKGATIEGKQLIVYGLCGTCASKKRN
jgi:Fur family ferric uptake transcriptional regulator